MKVYVNDILVERRFSKNHVKDLEETFNTLQKYKMKLNPMKCTFGITLENF